MNFKCKVCDQCYKGVAAFRIHSLDVHSIEDPELGKLLRCLQLNFTSIFHEKICIILIITM